VSDEEIMDSDESLTQKGNRKAKNKKRSNAKSKRQRKVETSDEEDSEGSNTEESEINDKEDIESVDEETGGAKEREYDNEHGSAIGMDEDEDDRPKLYRPGRGKTIPPHIKLRSAEVEEQDGETK
jgi:hypothetical protein